MEIAIVLILLIVAIVLFARETFSVDITTLLLLAALVLTGLLTPKEAFGGFSSDIIIILGSIFVITGALQQTGVVDILGSKLRKLALGSPALLTFALMGVVGFISAFMNNTTATALFVAPATGAARNLRFSPSKLLMPLAFASILGGTCTLIGTSTNVAVSGYITSVGLPPLGLFEFTKVGLLLVAVGTAYMMTVGRWLLPDYAEEDFGGDAVVREYLTEIVVMPKSHLVGQRVLESEVAKLGFQILEILRGQRRLEPEDNPLIAEGDILLVTGRAEELMKVKAAAGIEIRADVKHAQADVKSGDIKIAEAFVNPRSELIGVTLKQAGFRQRYGVTVLAVFRQGQALRDKLSHIRLRLGDVLLVQGTRHNVESLRRRRALTVLEELHPSHYRRKRGLFVVLVFAGAIALGGMNLVPLPVAVMLAAVAAILVGALTAQEAYQFIDWRMLVLIGGMMAFGTAMTKTGTANFLANHLGVALAAFGPQGMLVAFFTLTVLLTQPMSNAAAALVVLPIALDAAGDLGANPRTFAITVMLAASVSFITPLEPSCLLVYGPGKYKFMDFVKVGLGLTVLLSVLLLWLIPKFWPLLPPS